MSRSNPKKPTPRKRSKASEAKEKKVQASAQEETSARAHARPSVRKSVGEDAKQQARRATVNARERAAQMRSQHEAREQKAQAAAEAKSQQTSKNAAPKRASKVSKRTKIVLALVLAVVLAVGATVAYCVWDIWYRYDDTADIQGEWISQEGAALIIDGSQMRLTDTVSYAYTIDTQAKTISFTYANAQGQAAYHFSPDRQQLVIEDGGTTDWLVILGVASDTALTETPGAGTTVLTRVN